MILIQFFGMILLVLAMMFIAFIVNIVISLFAVKRRLKEGIKGMSGGAKRRAAYNKYGASGNTSSADAPNGKKKIIPQDEGEYVDFTEL